MLKLGLDALHDQGGSVVFGFSNGLLKHGLASVSIFSRSFGPSSTDEIVRIVSVEFVSKILRSGFARSFLGSSIFLIFQRVNLGFEGAKFSEDCSKGFGIGRRFRRGFFGSGFLAVCHFSELTSQSNIKRLSSAVCIAVLFRVNLLCGKSGY